MKPLAFFAFFFVAAVALLLGRFIFVYPWWVPLLPFGGYFLCIVGAYVWVGINMRNY
ncbi:MAG: hypothetical protein JWR85_4204 [Marmoricola sp.]|jgi:hypothetical protein|nr:hypothetical protein [Marmoricola sp.]